MGVGDYVRTKDYQNIRSRIGKIIKKDEKYYYLDINEDTQMVWEEDTVLKSSPQIIDLIEVGDYVNGLPVIRIYNESEKYDNSSYKFSMKVVEVKNDNYETIPFDDIFKNEEIKTILTHEQFESAAYRVEK